jgi:CheY-like chemotaxis protein
MPARSDIDPVELRFVLGNLILLDVVEPASGAAVPEFRCRVHGVNLAEQFGFDLTGKPVAHIPMADFRDDVIARLTKVVATRLPSVRTLRRVLKSHLCHYEVLWLPLSSDGHRIDRMLGGVEFIQVMSLDEATRREQAKPFRAEKTILVVDDDSAVLNLADTVLSELGYRVLLAGDGHAALSILEGGQRVDLVFSDIVMPNAMSGLDLARAVKARDHRIKVVLTTGFAPRTIDPDGVLNGFDLLRKPYRPHDLAGKIDAAFAAPRA